jgi:hypothetical protein
MTEPEPTATADEPPSSATDAVPDATLPDDRASSRKWVATATGPDVPISGVDIREVDTSDLVEVEKRLGLSVPTRPTSMQSEPAAELSSPMPDADPIAAFYAAKWAPEEETVDRRYRGQRRAKVAEPRFWAATVAVLAVIGGLLYWVLSLASLQGVGSPAPTESVTASVLDIAVGPSGPTSGIPSATPTAQPTSAAPTTGPSSVRLPPFKPITIEAESGTVGGSAKVVRNNRASGKHIVQQLGNWGSGAPGTLTVVTGVVPAAGTYAMTISYLHTNSEPTRSAIITVNSVALPASTFTATDGGCCFTLTIGLTLRAGTNTIIFSNPTDHAPGLDKFVISRPD